MGKITVVGSYIQIVTMDVERIPLEGETLTGHNYHTTPGGKGSNMAACAARLGADVTFLGKVGRDANGEFFLKLLKLGPEHVMLTLGEKGVLWASARGMYEVPVLAVKVVDTVGAGDAFNAGLAVGLSEDRQVLEAIALGVTAASLSTQRRETIASYSRRGEVDEFLPRALKAAEAKTNRTAKTQRTQRRNWN
jgi:sugar/nucleoside kinase (ribokinase family)